ncbi:MAG: LysM peptidoglycan-binding domain-containing protein [Bacteroidota bacterium]|jgi:membrane-bound lytic murein transglycosylase D|nr:LysM peptidoglycan-binding domain-containing protein [Bacteroidota bacterium]
MHLIDAHHRRGSGIVVLAIVAATFAIACSSQGELTKDERGESREETAAHTDSLITAQSVSGIPRPALEIEGVPTPEVNAMEKEPLLDRARMHIVLAAKALEQGDTLTTVGQCGMASDKLHRASYLPDIEMDEAYTELNLRLRALYRACAGTIEQSELDVPPSALAALADEASDADAVDLTTLHFKDPPPTVIPLPLNEEVEKNILYFTTKMRKHFVKWLERSGRYFPVMRPILKEEGMPEEIIFLTMIESGVNPTARSWAACVGLWQFLKSTGEMYGLGGDWHTDDRCDPEMATRAAARHLRDLYNRFDDWHLALAAYNAGAGRISRAIKKSGKRNPTFWDIQPLLPKETQNYVPRFIATSIIALDPKEYDLADVPLLRPLEYDIVTTDKPYDLSDLAALAGTTTEEIQTLNPTLLQPSTPPRSYALRVPKGTRETIAMNLANLKSRVDATAVTTEIASSDYRVRRGDNLYKIAKKHKVTVGQLVKANGLASARHLRIGEVLRIPRHSVTTTTASKVARDNMANPDSERDPLRRTAGRRKLTMRVETGQTLGGIARNFGVTVADLMTWNSIESHERLRAGRTLDVWVRPDAELPTNLAVLLDAAASDEDADAADASAAGLPASASASIAAAMPAAEQTDNTARPRGVAASATAASPVYTVQHGETLASIADAFNLTIQNLMEWNELPNSSIRSGSTLKLQPQPDRRADVQEKPAQEKPAQEKPAQEKPAQEKPASKKTTKAPVATPSNTANRSRTSEKPAVMERTPASREIDHTVQKGETLYRIATEHGVTVEQVMEWNKLSDANIRSGQRLVLRPTVDPTSRTQSPTSTTQVKVTTSSEVKPAREVKPASEVKPAKEVSTTYEVKAPGEVKPAGEVKAAGTVKQAMGESGVALETDDGIYTVRPGDNLYRIAKAAGVSVEELKTRNGLKSSAIHSGQKLIITPSPAGTSDGDGQPKQDAVKQIQARRERATPPSGNAESHPGSAGNGVRREHIVTRGETLHGIARTLGVPVSRLKEWNSIDGFIKPGQKIIYYTTE